MQGQKFFFCALLHPPKFRMCLIPGGKLYKYLNEWTNQWVHRKLNKVFLISKENSYMEIKFSNHIVHGPAVYKIDTILL